MNNRIKVQWCLGQQILLLQLKHNQNIRRPCRLSQRYNVDLQDYNRQTANFSFVPLRPFFYAALAKRWKAQIRQGFAYLNNNVDSKRHIVIWTAILYNQVNSGQIMKKTLSNNMSRKVHMKWRQRREFKIWKPIWIKIQVLPLAPVD